VPCSIECSSEEKLEKKPLSGVGCRGNFLGLQIDRYLLPKNNNDESSLLNLLNLYNYNNNNNIYIIFHFLDKLHHVGTLPFAKSSRRERGVV